MKNENRLIEEAPPSVLEKFVSQLNNPFTFVLFAAAAISLLLSEYSDVIVILAVVIFQRRIWSDSGRKSRARPGRD